MFFIPTPKSDVVNSQMEGLITLLSVYLLKYVINFTIFYNFLQNIGAPCNFWECIQDVFLWNFNPQVSR